MDKDIRHITIVIVLAAMLMLVSGLLGGLLGYNRGKARCEELPQADTIIIDRTDTVTLVENKIDTLIRYVNRLYPVAVYDTIVKGDTIFVSLPYEYRYYGVEDTLDIWYSGVDPKIDSARVYMHHTTEVIRQPYEVSKMPRLTADLGVTAFWNGSGINPYLIGEMRYNAPKTTFSAYGVVNHTGQWAAGVGVTYRINIIK